MAVWGQICPSRHSPDRHQNACAFSCTVCAAIACARAIARSQCSPKNTVSSPNTRPCKCPTPRYFAGLSLRSLRKREKCAAGLDGADLVRFGFVSRGWRRVACATQQQARECLGALSNEAALERETHLRRSTGNGAAGSYFTIRKEPPALKASARLEEQSQMSTEATTQPALSWNTMASTRAATTRSALSLAYGSLRNCF